MNRTKRAKRGPSLTDVARTVQVAPSTVSRVLNGDWRIGESTRLAVQAAVKKLAYVPLPGGRPAGTRGRTGRTNRVAVVIAGKTRAMLKSPVYTEVLHGVEAALAANGLAMMVRYLCHSELPANPLLPTKVDGLLLFGELDPAIVRREFRGLPVIHFMGVRSSGATVDHVSYDDSRVGELAAEYLLGRKHRQAVTVIGQDGSAIWSRCTIFARRFEEGGGRVLTLTGPEPLFVATDERNEANWGSMRRLTECVSQTTPQPTAAFLPLDMLVPAFYAAMREQGIEPGTNMDVIGCNNERPYFDSLHPRPATIDIHPADVGARAVEQLAWRLEHPAAPRVVIHLSPTLVCEEEEGSEPRGAGEREKGE